MSRYIVPLHKCDIASCTKWSVVKGQRLNKSMTATLVRPKSVFGVSDQLLMISPPVNSTIQLLYSIVGRIHDIHVKYRPLSFLP
jgi:hypothetical protein